MEAKLKRTGIDCYHKVFTQSLRREETQDSVVPDTMPDIDCILDTSGNVLLRSKDIGAGRIRMEANVASKVAYIPEGGQEPCCLDVIIPVQLSIEDEAIGDDSLCKAEFSLLSLDTRALNPRKVLVRAELCVHVNVWSRKQLEWCCAVEESDCSVNVRVEQQCITPCICVTERTFVLTDEYTVPAAKLPVCNVLGQRTEVIPEDVKAIGSKLMIKGSVKSSLLYGSDEGIASSLDFTTSFSQIVEACELGESPHMDVSLMLTGAYYDIPADGDHRCVNMELHLLAQAAVFDKICVDFLSDAYCNSYALALDRKEEEESCVTRVCELRDTIRESLELPQPALEVTDAYAVCGMAHLDGSMISLPVTVSIIYKTRDAKPVSLRRRFEKRFDAELVAGERVKVMGLRCGELYTALTSGGIELRMPVEVKLAVIRDTVINSIAAITATEENKIDHSDKPTLTLMMADASTDLWQLAKENCSTVDAIRRVNAIEEGSFWKKYIVIPKVI